MPCCISFGAADDQLLALAVRSPILAGLHHKLMQSIEHSGISNDEMMARRNELNTSALQTTDRLNRILIDIVRHQGEMTEEHHEIVASTLGRHLMTASR